MSYWALDFVNETECELVYRDQVYETEEEAEKAREATGRPELFDITFYNMLDLMEVYDTNNLTVDDELRVHATY